jgi:large exoprotein involved in heme utilization and adhesion
VIPDTLSGVFEIPAERGETHESNLFHSFSAFNIHTDESATFTGLPAINNVISRVIGGSQSFIDGPLRSEIQNANLYWLELIRSAPPWLFPPLSGALSNFII